MLTTKQDKEWRFLNKKALQCRAVLEAEFKDAETIDRQREIHEQNNQLYDRYQEQLHTLKMKIMTS